MLIWRPQHEQERRGFVLAQILDSTLKSGTAFLILVGLVLLFSRAPRAAVTIVLVLAVLEGSREWVGVPRFSLASVNVYWSDVVTAIMGGIALSRGAWRPASPVAVRIGLAGISAMTAFGLISWALSEGLQSAVNTWRPWTFAIAIVFYTTSFSRLRQPDGLAPFLWAALLASAMQAVGIVLRGFGSSADWVVIDGELVGARPISASVALIMLIGTVVLLLNGRRWTLTKFLTTTWLGISLIASQHRSVWVASAVAGLLTVRALVATAGDSKRFVLGTFSTIATVTTAILMVAVLRSQEQLSVSSRSTGTLEWRVENWAEKLTNVRSVSQWLFGWIFGPTQWSGPGTSAYARVSSHSMYVEAIVVIGLVGLSLVLVVSAGVIRRTSVSSPEHVVMTSLLAFGAFYQWPGVAWIVIGFAVGLPGKEEVGHSLSKRKLRSARSIQPPPSQRIGAARSAAEA